MYAFMGLSLIKYRFFICKFLNLTLYIIIIILPVYILAQKPASVYFGLKFFELREL